MYKRQEQAPAQEMDTTTPDQDKATPTVEGTAAEASASEPAACLLYTSHAVEQAMGKAAGYREQQPACPPSGACCARACGRCPPR